MKVCIAIEKFDPSVGGAERYCWDLANFLAGKGHKVAVICLKASEFTDPSIQIIKISALRFPQAVRHLSFAVLHFLKALGMRDFIHFCVGNTFFMDIYQPHGGVHRAWFLKETAIYRDPARTFIRFIRRLSPNDFVQRSMELWIFAVTKPQVIAISEMVADDIEKFFSYPRSRIHLIPNGVDLEKFTPQNRNFRPEMRQRYNIGPDEFLFLFVAQNPKLKGYEVMIKACLKLSSTSFKVLIIGPAHAWMRRLAEPLGERIVFAGKVDDLHRLYAASDCLIHPSYYDSFSLVVLEALASGIPVITTEATGVKMFVNGQNGIVVPPGDEMRLADAIQHIYDHRASMKKHLFGLRDQRQVFHEIEGILNNAIHYPGK